MKHILTTNFAVEYDENKDIFVLTTNDDDLLDHTAGGFRLKIPAGSAHDAALRSFAASLTGEASEKVSDPALEHQNSAQLVQFEPVILTPVNDSVTSVSAQSDKSNKVITRVAKQQQFDPNIEYDIEDIVYKGGATFTVDDDVLDDSEQTLLNLNFNEVREDNSVHIDRFAGFRRSIIPLGFELQDKTQFGVWNLTNSAHLAIIGEPASGKTHLAENIELYCRELARGNDRQQMIDEKVVLYYLKKYAEPEEVSSTVMKIYDIIDERNALLERDKNSPRAGRERKFYTLIVLIDHDGDEVKNLAQAVLVSHVNVHLAYITRLEDEITQKCEEKIMLSEIDGQKGLGQLVDPVEELVTLQVFSSIDVN